MKLKYEDFEGFGYCLSSSYAVACEMLAQSRKPQTFGDVEEDSVLPMDRFVLE